MTMSEKGFNEMLAHHPDVQANLKRRASRVAERAAARHAAHRDTGDSYITLEHGDVDWYIVLNDERGLEHAWNIEYGQTDRDGEFRDGIHTLSAEVGDPYT